MVEILKRPLSTLQEDFMHINYPDNFTLCCAAPHFSNWTRKEKSRGMYTNFFLLCMLTNFVFCAVLRFMTEHCCVFVFSAADSSENETGYQPYINDKECPRKPDLIGDRKCLKKCRNNKDCRGRNKKCMCDDVCGKSCVKPSKLRTALKWCMCYYSTSKHTQYQIYQSWH